MWQRAARIPWMLHREDLIPVALQSALLFRSPLFPSVG